jgi:molybdopterin molybdotransferase
MAQLTDDCFAFSGPLLPLEEMERLIQERVQPIGGKETVALGEAAGRVLAADVIATLDLPPFDNSAVDGYAVRHRDLNPDAETSLDVAGRVMAGHRPPREVGAGQAVRIFTGAVMPADADTVFMQEDVRTDGDKVIVPPGLKAGANRRLAGEDMKAGAVALPAGRVLSPADVALAAALGLTTLAVRPQLRVALFSTGDEIVEPGTVRPPSALFDANRALLAGLLARRAVVVSDLGIVPDNPDALRRAIAEAARTHDLVLTSGGVSTGEADHVRTAGESIGKLVFWRVAIKPGRPVAMGVVEGAAFAGLPGNPVAAFVTFVRVVRPLLLRLGGALPQTLVPLPVKASFSYRKKKGRREYVRVALRCAADGSVEAVKHPQEGAGVITSLTETDGLAELADDTTKIEPGATVGFLSNAALIG